MKLTVFGATGGTGQQIVRQSLDAGHQVTAVVRDPTRLPISHADLRVVTADVTDARALRPVLTGGDAAVSALGPRTKAQIGIAYAATHAILTAMPASGVSRLIALSAVPVGPMPPDEGALIRLVMTPLLNIFFGARYADLARMEEEIRRADEVEWTIVRPPRLLDKPLTGSYRRAIGANVRGGRSISRADLAHAMLALITDPVTVRQAVGVAY